MRIGRHEVGPEHPPLIIAELSANHNGSLERALAVVDAVAEAGAQVLKLQTYTADTITLDSDRPEFLIDNPKSPWAGRRLYELYQEGSTPWEWHAPIAQRCAELGLEWFSSPFDPTAVDFLADLGAPAYKIASFEIVDLPLIRKAASQGKPLVISTGMATLAEIDAAVRTAREAGTGEIVLLQCTSTYPATPANSNLRTIPHLAQAFGCLVGLSDHTLGLGVPIAAVALGAVVIEKHVTLARSDGGVDAAFSLEPDELRALVVETERARQSLGEARYGPLPEEAASLAHRRSLYITQDLEAGDELTSENLRSVRPANGLPPAELDALLGQRVGRDVARGTPASWDLLTPPR
ncbi:pseudaminic acid synthase [Solirubrobacter soli]|uniref:pseudaminic acid synthase n=1 Tax=Solirubrobacter soli TaxID=363832 RepID=UPI000427843A|nr:pseudaminic acid synthase [Solirubrobacter soli]